MDQTFTFTRVYAIEQNGKPSDVLNCRDGGECGVISTATNAPITKSDINPNYGRATAYQAPRGIRLGARLSF